MTQDDQRAALAFLELLSQAAESVADPWFLLPFADSDSAASVYRERVYCYELYHQIRKLSDEATHEQADRPTYVLSGEIDKSGLNAVVEGGRHKPDFVWHVPGTYRNAVIVEVKSAASIDDAEKDLQTLAAFLGAPSGRGYARGVLLVYGSSRSEQDL